MNAESSIAAHFAAHNERINACAAGVSEAKKNAVDAQKGVSKLTYWVMGTLVTALVGTLGVLVELVFHFVEKAP